MSQDPFATPPQAAPPTPTPSAGYGQPGGYGQPMPYGTPATFPGYAPAPTREVDGHARFAKAGAIAAAVAGLCLAASNYVAVSTPEDDLNGALALLALIGVAVLGGLAGYLTLCTWMSRVSDIVKSQGYPTPESWKIWAGWIIPFYNLAAPVRAMDKLAFKAGKERMTLFLTLWWGGFLASSIASRLTGLANVEASTVVVLSVVEAVAALVSLAGLLVLIARISAVATIPPPAQALPSAPPTGTPLQPGPATWQQPPAGFSR